MNTPYFVLCKTNMVYINTTKHMIPISFVWYRGDSNLSRSQFEIIKEWGKELNITKIHDLNTNEVIDLC